MLSLALRPVRPIARAVLANNSPRQIAAGLMLGMMLGLLPKGNLTAVALVVLLLGLRVNQPVALVGVAVFTWWAALVDGFAHQLGSALLVWPPLRELHEVLYATAIGPLFGWNNTVVVGQLAIGLYLAIPVYWTAYHIVSKVQTPLGEWWMHYKATRRLHAAEITPGWGESQ